MNQFNRVAAAAAWLGATHASALAPVADYPIHWPRPASGGSATHGGHEGSTHEIAWDERRGGDLWISGQNWDSLARVDPASRRMRFLAMPRGSGPHGIEFDAAGRLWVTLEFHGRVQVRDPADGRVIADHDVRLHCRGCPQPINSHPHGLGIGPDGRTAWFTGKATGTVGRIAPDGTVTTWPLRNVGSVPIYIRAGPDGNMWVTELVGNAIARVTPDGRIDEFQIPTPNSRPIAIVPGRDGAMWFSEETGGKIGRIDRSGGITEIAVPRAHPAAILAGLSFDGDGNLWVQQYAPAGTQDAGPDHLIRIDRAALAPGASAATPRAFTFYPVSTLGTVMHRIMIGPDRALWFTEMQADRVGRLAI
jgi:virginiamycin B lyase